MKSNTLNDLLSAITHDLLVPLPDYGKPVLAVVEACYSKEQRYAVLMAVDADDHCWVTYGDESELSYSWDVLGWIYLPELRR